MATFAVHATEDPKTICLMCCQEGHLIDKCPAAEQDEEEPTALLIDAEHSGRCLTFTWLLSFLALCAGGMCAAGRKLH